MPARPVGLAWITSAGPLCSSSVVGPVSLALSLPCTIACLFFLSSARFLHQYNNGMGLSQLLVLDIQEKEES